MKKSNLLRLVKDRMRLNEQLICVHLVELEEERQRDARRLMELRDWIRHLLGGAYTYQTWIYHHHPHLMSQMLGRAEFLEGRLQWLDWMIEYWEEQEKK